MARLLAKMGWLVLCLTPVTCRVSSPVLPSQVPALGRSPIDAPPPSPKVESFFASDDTCTSPPDLPPLPALAVEELGPKGSADTSAEPYVRFNQQVVSVGDDLLTEPSIMFELSPRVAGRSRFRTPELLVFEPKALKLAQHYQVRVAATASATAELRGFVASHDLTWAFDTPGPAVQESYPRSNESPERWTLKHPALIKLTQPVSVWALRKQLTVRTLGPDSRPIVVRVDPVSLGQARHWDWASDILYDDAPLADRLFQVRPLERWPVDRQIEIEVAAGVVGRLGPVPSTSPWRVSWKTPGPLRVESVTTEDPYCDQSSVVIHLGAAIAASQLSHIRVSPRPVNTQISLDGYYNDTEPVWARTGADIRLRGAFVPGRTYTLKIDPSLRDLDGYTVGDGTAGQPWSTAIAIAGEPSLQLSPGGIFPAVTNPIFGVTSRMVSTLRVRAAPLSPEQTARVKSGSADLKSAGVFEKLGVFAEKIVVRDVALDVQAPTYWSDQAMDLRDLVGDIRGAVLVEVAPLLQVQRPTHAAATEPLAVQREVYERTDLGPIAFHSVTQSIVKVARLSDGRPAAGVRVARIEGERQVPLGRTDGDGLLALSWKPEQRPIQESVFVVSDEISHDHAVLRVAAANGHFQAQERGLLPGEQGLLRHDEHVLLSLTTERDAYRPEESVAFVGYALVDTPFARSGLRLLPAGTPVMVKVLDREQKVAAEQSLPLGGDGKFWARLPIRKGTPLGTLTVTAQLQGMSTAAHVKLEDFRVPEFEVTARAANDALLVGDSTAVRVRANHYSGVPVTFDEVAYATSCRAVRHSVPGLSPEWIIGDAPRMLGTRRITRSARRVVTGAQGVRGSIEFTPSLDVGDATSLLCSLAVEVKDASQQAIATETSIRIHPASFYLALREPRNIHAGERVQIPLQALSIDGQRRAVNNVKVGITRRWLEEVHDNVEGRVRTSWRERRELVASCPLETALDRDAACWVESAKEGEYSIEASAREGSRVARTTAAFHVYPKHMASSPAHAKEGAGTVVEHLELEVVRANASQSPAREFAPGDRLRATLRSPCVQGTAIALLERAGIREQHPLKLADHTATLDLLVDDTWVPHVDLSVQTVCKSEVGYPVVQNAQQRVNVSSAHRELNVQLTVPAQAAPGQNLPLRVEVRDHEGQPVARGHVTVWAVDEAVLSLGDYRVQNPLHQFVPKRQAETSMAHGYGALIHAYVPTPSDPLLNPGVCEAFGAGGFGLGGMGEGGGAYGHGVGLVGPPPARARFESTPIFIGEQLLDDHGSAQLLGQLPDNLTTFRVTAIASAPLANDVTTGRFGVGESPVQVTAPLILRPVLPRQMRPGDTAEIAAILQNQTDRQGKVTLTASVDEKSESLTFLDAQSQEALLEAGSQIRLPLRVRAARPGVAQVQLQARFVPASGEALSDGVRIPLPVVTEPASMERAAYYGTLDSSAAVAVAVRAPSSAEPSVGGLSLSLSTSLTGELQDAFQYLLDYPYGCIEQTASRVLALVAARELAQRFGLESAEAQRRLSAGIERIVSMQTASGGFAYWPEQDVPHPYATGFATRVLWLAQKAGVKVPEAVLGRALDYLNTWVQEGVKASHGEPGAWHSTAVFPSERAMALAVLADAGRTLPPAALDEALSTRASLPHFARTLLLSALDRAKPGDPRVTALTDELLASIREQPATAHVLEVQDYSWVSLFPSQSRSDAMALFTLLQLKPAHALVPKLARGLMEARTGGRWRNTQENVYALLALLEYARRFEAERPDFTVRAWLGKRPLVETRLTWAAPNKAAFLPTAQLIKEPQPSSVVLQRTGQGRLYYRLGTQWQQPMAEVSARDQGLTLERTVRLRSGAIADAVPVGQSVAFDLVLTNRSPLSYVAIDVPVPAGLEPVLDNLGKGHRVSRWGGATFASYEERHPERVLLFVDDLPAGEHHHRVQLRATTVGEFALPAVRAEAMYMPEIYGRTASGRLTVTQP